MKILLSIVLTICTIDPSNAQGSITELMYNAYLTQNKDQWKKCITLAKQEAQQNPNNGEKQLDLAIASYSLLNATMVTKDEDLFDEYVSLTKENIEKVIVIPKVAGDGKALLSGVLGLQMAYSPMKGFILGGKSSNLAEEGKRLAPNSPIAWRFYGINKFYTPSSFGGDVNESTAALEESIALFETTPAQLINNWLYVDTIVVLGKAYQKLENNEKSIAAFEKALRIEPKLFYAQQLLVKVKK